MLTIKPFKRRSAAARRRRRSFADSAWVQTLEDRTLLSCSVQLLGDGTLHIQGDEGDNLVNIVEHGGGRVDVECHDAGRDSGESMSFENVSGILTEMLGGDDMVTVSAGLRSPIELLHVSAYRLGAGDDVLTMNLGSRIVGPAGSRIEIDGGPGIDDVSATAATLTVDGVFTWDASGGRAGGETSDKPTEIIVVGSGATDGVRSAAPGLYVRGTNEAEQLDLRLTSDPGDAGRAHGHLDYLKQAGDPATGEPIGDTTSIRFDDVAWRLPDDGAVVADIQTFGGNDEVAVEGSDLRDFRLHLQYETGDPAAFKTTNNLKQIVLAVHTHVDSHPHNHIYLSNIGSSGGDPDGVSLQADHFNDVELVYETRDPAASTGNLKQLGLAWHNFGDTPDTTVHFAAGLDGLRVQADRFNTVDLLYENRPPSAILPVEEPEQISLNDVSFPDNPNSHVEFDVGPDGFAVETANFNESTLQARLPGVADEAPPVRHVLEIKLSHAVIADWRQTVDVFQAPGEPPALDVETMIATPADYAVELDADGIANIQFGLNAPGEHVDLALTGGVEVDGAGPTVKVDTSHAAADGTTNVVAIAERYAVCRVNAETGNANDTIRVEATAPARGPDGPPTSFDSSFILGEGDDDLNVVVHGYNEQTHTLDAGAGDDVVRYVDPVEQPEQISLNDASYDDVKLGPGDDMIDIVLDFRPPPGVDLILEGQIAANIQGEEGNDTIRFDMFGDASRGGSTTFRGPINLTFDGGAGVDDVGTPIEEVAIEEDGSVDLPAGSSINLTGFENSRVLFEDVELDRSLSWIVQVAPGDGASQPLRHRTDLRNVRIAGRFEQNIQGTPWDDVVTLRLDGVVVDSGGEFRAEVNGHAGADRIIYNHTGFIIQPFAMADVQFFGGDGADTIIARGTAEIGGEYSFAASGGAGNDVIRIEDSLTALPQIGRDEPAASPRINYTLDGGADDDQLLLLADVADDLDPFFAALIDGGDGFDFCAVGSGVPPNVKGVNCEATGGSR